MTSALHIALLDDEVDITRLLATYLQAQGYRVTELHNGPALMALMQADTPALVLLDLGLPGEDGFSIARQLREHWRCGLIIVTGRGDAVDKVVGLEVGADDYVTKPFDLRELLARIKAVLRRLSPAEPQVPAAAAVPATTGRLVFAGWELDPQARRLLSPARPRCVAHSAASSTCCARWPSTPGGCSRATSCSSRTRGREAGPVRPHDRRPGRSPAQEDRGRPGPPADHQVGAWRRLHPRRAGHAGLRP